jgi:aldose 1-epimerase
VTAPSGEQIELRAGDQRAVVVEVGAGLRDYRHGDTQVLHGYGRDEIAGAGHGQLLLPWPNRIGEGAYSFDGVTHQLPLNELERRNAIHGLVRWLPWLVRDREPNRVSLEHRLHPQPGYPFALRLTADYQLTAEGLAVRLGAVNEGDGPCPFGAGAHPYLTLRAPVDGLELRVPAATVIRSDERGLPRETVDVDADGLDFRDRRPIGATVLDHCFGTLDRDSDGIARVTLDDPASGDGVTLWVDAAYPYLMVFTGDPVPDVNRRALAVEPMSCPPDAFRSGEALVQLQPGESWSGSWGIAPRLSPP